MIQEIALIFLQFIAIYFLCVNVIYGVQMLFSWIRIKRHEHHSRKHLLEDEHLPAVSFLIPAFNEESLIVETIQTYLSLPNVKKEIIVINDGSSDQTFRLLQVMFQLQRQDPSGSAFLSITYPELIVLAAPHTGKAQSLNFGVAHAKYDLICTMDADTIPDAKGVESCLRSFAHHPELIAAGGVIQVLNTQILKDNAPFRPGSQNWLTTFQSIEYLRTFLCERLGWCLLNSTTLISGAFCMVKKQSIQRIGGFRKESITEDLDLIIRLRKSYASTKGAFRILPVTTCYTQAPDRRRHLMVQRMRWQMGLVQTLARNIDMIFNPSLGLLGMVAIPYAWLVEVLSPLLSFMAMVILPVALINEWVALTPVLLFLGLGLIYNILITVAGIYLDQRYVSQTKTRSLTKSIFYTVMLLMGFKQLTSWWRLKALVKCLSRAQHWGEKPRKEIVHL